MYRRDLKSWAKHFDFLLGDLIMVTLAYVLALQVRVHLDLDQEFYWQPVLEVQWMVLLLIYALCALGTSAYKNIIRRDRWSELYTVLLQTVRVFAVFNLYLYVVQLAFVFSRVIFGLTAVFSFFLIYGFRIIWKRMIRLRIIRNHDLPQMILIANHETAEGIVREFNKRAYDMFELSGIVIMDRDMSGQKILGTPVVCRGDQLKAYLMEHVVDEAYVSVGSGTAQNDIVDYLLELGVAVHICLMINTERLPNRMMERIGGHTVMTTSNQTASVIQLWAKRLMDILGALIGLVITGVLYLFLAPQIKKADPGPVFFAQERVGKNGRVFKLYKFRSMYQDAEQRKNDLLENNEMDGLMFKLEDDPRILPGVGEFIRKTSLDEFPQFYNVLLGNMSLVGTRPPTVDEFRHYAPHHKMRLSFNPGITGLWQVSGRNNITDFEEVVRLDNEYIKTWSIWLDIRILCKTILVVLTRDGAK
jgi:exopolysaccharide biosynthesis polyprenyl glycosylphosphotransferase